MEAPSGFEPEMEVLQTSALPLGDGAVRLSRGSVPPARRARGERKWSGKRDSNPRLRPWQGRTLPLSYSRSRRTVIVPQRFRGSQWAASDGAVERALTAGSREPSTHHTSAAAARAEAACRRRSNPRSRKTSSGHPVPRPVASRSVPSTPAGARCGPAVSAESRQSRPGGCQQEVSPAMGMRREAPGQGTRRSTGDQTDRARRGGSSAGRAGLVPRERSPRAMATITRRVGVPRGPRFAARPEPTPLPAGGRGPLSSVRCAPSYHWYAVPVRRTCTCRPPGPNTEGSTRAPSP